MAENWEFSEDEIRDKLAELGYSNIPREKLQEFANGKGFVRLSKLNSLFDTHVTSIQN